MIIGILLFLIFSVIFTAVQTLILKKDGLEIKNVAKEQLERIRESKGFRAFILNKEIRLKKQGADVFIRDGITLSQWYLYKALFAVIFGFIARILMVNVLKWEAGSLIAIGVAVFSWFFPDILLSAKNRSSNEEMLPDICEMSRSVLYGKKGGQYRTDAIMDAVYVVENKRLKMALIRLKGNLDAGRSLEEAIDEFEFGFTSGEISAFCSIIKSLQATGHVEEALKTLETSIERGQASVNKRKCIKLENRTMVYVMLIAFDLLIMILYCIIMKLLDMQISF